MDIPDDKGRFNRWLVIAPANINDVQFPTWELLRCDYCFQYVIFENNRRVCKEVAGVRRSQNSYNIICYLIQKCIMTIGQNR